MTENTKAVAGEGNAPRVAVTEGTVGSVTLTLERRLRVEKLIDERDELQGQVAELLAAAKDVSQWAWNTGTHKAWQDRLNAAIAKCEGNFTEK